MRRGRHRALTKLGSAETGDTVSAASDPLLLSCWNLPDPLLPVAVVARSRADEDALGRTLDPARRRGPDAAAGAQPRDPPDGAVVHGRGARRRRALPAAGRAAPRSTPSRCRCRCARRSRSPARVTGRHVKQSGGHGQYAVCHVEFEPLPRGSGFEFVSKVVGGSVPTQFIPSVEKGIRSPARARADRRAPPGRRPAGDAGRRQGAQRRLLGRRVPDRGRAGAAGGGPGVRDGAARAARRGGRHASRTTTSARCWATCPDAAGGCWARTSRARDGRWCAPRCRAPSCCATRSTCGR